ncbi:hypothetical protein D9M72_537710 [compost metagenome]
MLLQLMRQFQSIGSQKRRQMLLFVVTLNFLLQHWVPRKLRKNRHIGTICADALCSDSVRFYKCIAIYTQGRDLAANEPGIAAGCPRTTETSW